MASAYFLKEQDSKLVDLIFDIINPLYLLLDTTHLTKQLNCVPRF